MMAGLCISNAKFSNKCRYITGQHFSQIIDLRHANFVRLLGF
jgi:predicted nucleic-acid-binding Zn-ribbon protein